MAYSYEDAMSEFFGHSSKPHYTTEQIDLAKKRQKKCGGTFMDNLEAVGRGDIDGKSAGIKANPLDKILGEMKSNGNTLEKPDIDSTNTTSDLVNDLNSSNDISQMIKGLNASLEKEYGISAENAPISDKASALKAFEGLADVLKSDVYGQDAYIKKLIIAFKRPFVTQREAGDAMNCILIHGPEDTGKHYGLNMLVEELGKRRVLGSKEIVDMDLSLYPSAGEENLFIQDLYSAISGRASVILFENMDKCHIANLSKLVSLVTEGECRLQNRYIMKNGQLISVSNALAGDIVGSLEAKDKYLVFMSSQPLDKVAGVMGAPFINALGDICETYTLEDESIKQISAEQEKNLIDNVKKQLSYVISLDDEFRDYILSFASKGRAVKGVLDIYEDIMKALTELRLERDDMIDAKLSLSIRDSQPIIIIGEEELQLGAFLPKGYKGELDIVKEELNNIVGLKEVKDYILSLEEYYGVQKKRKEAGLKAGEVNKHMIFTGNPGTGKTTIARIVSKYLKAIGILSGGQLVEVSRGDLVGRYSGHTAPLTNQVIKSAIGGVLFIDEAYSLYRGREDSFGLEAIDTLVKGIEDNRDDLVVILAGYSKEMEEFLETNSGLKSRFPNIIDFPDYTGEELLAIAQITAKSKGYVIADEAKEPLLNYFNFVQATRAREAGNGRLVRNKIEEAILNQSRRLVVQKDADMSLLVLMDFELEE